MTDNDTQSVSDVFEEFAEYLQLDGQDGRAYAYESAARSLRRAHFIPPNPADLDGVGDNTRLKIAEYQRSGTIHELEELKDEYAWYDSLSDIDGVGTKRARQMNEKLHIENADDILLVGSDLTLIDGIGSKTASKIIASARDKANKGNSNG